MLKTCLKFSPLTLFFTLFMMQTFALADQVYILTKAQIIQGVFPYTIDGAWISGSKRTSTMRFIHGQSKAGESIVLLHTDCFSSGTNKYYLHLVPSKNTGQDFYYSETVIKSYETSDLKSCTDDMNLLKSVGAMNPIQLSLGAGTFKLSKLEARK